MRAPQKIVVVAYKSFDKNFIEYYQKNNYLGNFSGRSKTTTIGRKNVVFWKAVPPVTISLHQSPGLINAIGIGEAPIGLQGTFSLWESASHLREFAYKGQAHTQAIKATEENKWYSEELFSRFAVIQERGNLK